MPAIRRMARSCALSVVSLAVAGSALATAPAHASEDRGAVALSSSQVSTYNTLEAQRRERAAQRRQAAARRLDRRILGAERIALAQRGDRYAYGAAGPNAFDCSGLIYYSYRRAGFNVPRTSGAQAGFTRRVAKNNMRPGDLMFFYGSGGVYHVGIYVGRKNGRVQMLHSSTPGRPVQVAAPWTNSWFGGTLRR